MATIAAEILDNTVSPPVYRIVGDGDPTAQGFVCAPGSIYLRRDATSATNALYVKIGTDATAWAALGGGAGGTATVALSQLAQTGATVGQVLAWNGTTYAPTTIGGTGGGTGGTTSTGHRYWRARVYSGGYVGMIEIEMHATAGGPNLCTSGTAICSSAYNGLPASAAFDGSLSSAWAGGSSTSSANQEWIGWDFGAGVTPDIQEFKMYPRNESDQRPVGVMPFEYSDDMVTWTLAWSVTNPSWTGGAWSTFTKP